MKIKIRYAKNPGSDFSRYTASCWITWFPLRELYGFSDVSFYEARAKLMKKVEEFTSNTEVVPRPEKMEL